MRDRTSKKASGIQQVAIENGGLDTIKVQSNQSGIQGIHISNKNWAVGSEIRVKEGQGVTIGTELDTVDTGGSQTPPVKGRKVAVNDEGRRIGETHSNARLSDADVDAIRDEYEAHPPGHPLHVGYRLLAKRWKVGKRTVRDICNYNRRNQWAARWKPLP